ncbi:hypothetical protein PENTCL1PPCAC_14972 [Pristionchus entomophagus]|uniref:Uncharacterized protein n=1 Tax=Pristionchus entomophagus TaxID=358040 RepID=A0AAV5TD31_9BILA|nr:hypothetical protein PENTCL1PPCAC_14972 [Pristionchus entomophagus]
MAEDSSRVLVDEMDRLRKRRRLALVLAESARLPDAYATTFPAPITAKELLALNTRCETPGYEDECSFQYRAEYKSSFAGEEYREWNSNKHGWNSTEKKGAIKQAKVTDLASRALKEGGAYLMGVETKVDQLRTRELREQERFLVEGLARMEMIGVKREKEADNLVEALQEWIEDAERLVALNDQEMFFSVVSKVHKDDNEENEMEGEEEKGDSKVNSLSFSTLFNGTEYSITVEMPNDSVVRVKARPHLGGLEEIIEDALAVCSLLDAITSTFWKLAGPVK